MTILAAATVLAAVLSTIITALWTQSHWSADSKRITSGVVAAVLGIAVAIASNQIVGVPDTWGAVVARWLLILGGVAAGAQAFFAQFKGILSKFEDLTTLFPSTTDDADAGSAPVLTDDTPADTESDAVAEDTSGVPPNGDADAEIVGSDVS